MRLRSLRGTDAEHLTLIDADLSRCVLSGLRRPEQLRLEGRCVFAPTPRGWHRRWGIRLWRWSAREALFEEHLWRASNAAPDHAMTGPVSLMTMPRTSGQAIQNDWKSYTGSCEPSSRGAAMSPEQQIFITARWRCADTLHVAEASAGYLTGTGFWAAMACVVVVRLPGSLR